MNQNWLWTILTAILAIVLIYFVVQGVLYVGWAIGGVIGVILAIFLVLELLPIGGFLGSIIAVLILAWIIDFLV